MQHIRQGPQCLIEFPFKDLFFKKNNKVNMPKPKHIGCGHSKEPSH